MCKVTPSARYNDDERTFQAILIDPEIRSRMHRMQWSVMFLALCLIPLIVGTHRCVVGCPALRRNLEAQKMYHSCVLPICRM